MSKTPVINVGIQFSKTIEISFLGDYKLKNGKVINGKWEVVIGNDKIILINSDKTIEDSSNIIFTPVNESSHFTLHNVTIGINFHWERNEDQSFKGGLKLIFCTCFLLLFVRMMPVKDGP